MTAEVNKLKSKNLIKDLDDIELEALVGGSSDVYVEANVSNLPQLPSLGGNSLLNQLLQTITG